MMNSVNTLVGCRVLGRDGEVGVIRDVYFDDERWAIRYAIVHTGNWLFGRQVLISPVLVTEARVADGALHVDLTRAQIQASPDINTQKPVSRQMELAYWGYYRYPPYWAYGSTGPLWGWGPLPNSTIEHSVWKDMVAREMQERESRPGGEANEHLRSAHEVIGYAIEAKDGSIGHIDDLLFDESSWALRHIVVDTRNWWPGKHVVIAPARFKAVSWSERNVHVDLTREQVKSSPEFDSVMLRQRGDVRADPAPRAGDGQSNPAR